MLQTNIRLIGIFLLCAVISPAYANDIEFTVTDLGTLGGPVSAANAISQNGIIVGYATPNATTNHPFLWQGDGPMQDLGLLDPVNGVVGVANSVNSKGQVVGDSDSAGPGEPTHAFLYNAGGSLVDLGTLGGQSSYAYGINESGQICGNAQTASGMWDGVLWTVGGGTVDLGSGFLDTSINNQGILGGVATQSQHAALYNISSGSMSVLATLSGGTGSQVNALNDTGLAVGESDVMVDGKASGHGFVYDINTGVLTDLGNPVSPLFESGASGVNDLAQVVGGYQTDAAYDTAAFIWTQAGGMQNLNNLINPSLGWDLWNASSINNSGEIIGQGVNPQGRIDAVLLTPVPEPSPFSLAVVLLTIFVARLAWACPLAHDRRVSQCSLLFLCFLSILFFQEIDDKQEPQEKDPITYPRHSRRDHARYRAVPARC